MLWNSCVTKGISQGLSVAESYLDLSSDHIIKTEEHNKGALQFATVQYSGQVGVELYTN
jgi:hypothetical protein